MTEKKATKNAAKKAASASKKDEAEAAVLENIAAMPALDRKLGERLHSIVKLSFLQKALEG